MVHKHTQQSSREQRLTHVLQLELKLNVPCREKVVDRSIISYITVNKLNREGFWTVEDIRSSWRISLMMDEVSVKNLLVAASSM